MVCVVGVAGGDGVVVATVGVCVVAVDGARVGVVAVAGVPVRWLVLLVVFSIVLSCVFFSVFIFVLARVRCVPQTSKQIPRKSPSIRERQPKNLTKITVCHN